MGAAAGANADVDAGIAMVVVVVVVDVIGKSKVEPAEQASWRSCKRSETQTPVARTVCSVLRWVATVCLRVRNGRVESIANGSAVNKEGSKVWQTNAQP